MDTVAPADVAEDSPAETLGAGTVETGSSAPVTTLRAGDGDTVGGHDDAFGVGGIRRHDPCGFRCVIWERPAAPGAQRLRSHRSRTDR